jgi:hypothetical protein
MYIVLHLRQTNFKRLNWESSTAGRVNVYRRGTRMIEWWERQEEGLWLGTEAPVQRPLSFPTTHPFHAAD